MQTHIPRTSPVDAEVLQSPFGGSIGIHVFKPQSSLGGLAIKTRHPRLRKALGGDQVPAVCLPASPSHLVSQQESCLFIHSYWLLLLAACDVVLIACCKFWPFIPRSFSRLMVGVAMNPLPWADISAPATVLCVAPSRPQACASNLPVDTIKWLVLATLVFSCQVCGNPFSKFPPL